MIAFGPVFRHEMLAAGRKRRYFFGSAAVAAVMLGLLCVIHAAQDFASGGELSIRDRASLTAGFYYAFAWTTMFGVLGITPVVVAGAIATERERRTIEYLFATDLSNAEIVFDKLTARLLTVGRLVLAGLPVLAIFRMLGGVPGTLLLVHFGMLASTALVCASIALVVSAWCNRAREAVPRALRWVVIWLLALPLTLWVYALVAWTDRPWAGPIEWLLNWIVAFLGVTNPVAVLATAAGGTTAGALGVDVDTTVVATMIGLHVAISALLLGGCVAMVRRVHLRGAAVVAKSKKGGTPAAAAARRLPYDNRPMLWKEMYAASVAMRGRVRMRRIGWGILTALIAGPMVLTFGIAIRDSNFGGEQYLGFAITMAYACGSLLVLTAGTRAAGLITNERERDTWTSLLTTDLSAAEILSAKMWGTLYALRWPLVGITMIPLAGVVFEAFMGLATIGFLAALLVVGWAATAIGIAYSLRLKSSTKAVGATVFTLLVISLVYPVLAVTLLSLSRSGEEAAWILAAPPVAPLLMAIPMLVVFEGGINGDMSASFVAGMLLYSFLGFVITKSNISVFDQTCGRSVAAHPAGQTGASDESKASAA